MLTVRRTMHQKTARRPAALWMVATIAGMSGWSPCKGASQAGVDPTLAAYWDFDEPAGGVLVDRTESGCDAVLDPRKAPEVARVRGVFSEALRFRGQHLVRVGSTARLRIGARGTLSFSAWVLPEDLGSYREIFRKEDGDRRVLFSFQHGGTILSLGLNVGGYAECDAPVDPAVVLDGRWHHAAATFDGRWFRVYLDGREIGSLERPGKLLAGGAAPGCIGSSNGGECFQGYLDELRIYHRALEPSEVTRLYERGTKALAERRAALEVAAGAFLVTGPSFPAALEGTRKRARTKGVVWDGELGAHVRERLRSLFPVAARRFESWTGLTLTRYVTEPSAAPLQASAARLVELLLEYRPLTEWQWARQSPRRREAWAEAEALAARMEELESRGGSGEAWIALLLEAGGRVRLRPATHEAVAPYTRPSTPETRRRTPAEAEDVLRRDWLRQAAGVPLGEAIQREIRWTRELARKLAERYPRKVVPAPELAKLTELEETLQEAREESAEELYFRIRELKRSLMLKSPSIDFRRVLCIDVPYPRGSEWRHETRHRLGYMAVPGGRLLVLDGLSPGADIVQLMPEAPLHGSFWRPDLSFDAKRVLVSFKPHNEKTFHLYEIGIDGSGLVELTSGPFDDLDPIYLPDGKHILFSTTRGRTYVRCMPPTNAFVLARARRDGSNLYIVSKNNEPDYLPSLLHDGRVVYTRWEYTDKPLWRAQSLWTVYPDGTQASTLWGNQSVWPDLLKDARPIPSSGRVMFTGSAHHDWFAGSVGIIDPDRGTNFPHGITKVTADVPWPESGNGPVDPVESPDYHSSGQYDAYYSPFPLSEWEFLVSARGGGKYRLYLMDVDGNRELIYEGAHHVLHAVPVKPRQPPPVLADRVSWPVTADGVAPKQGVIYSTDVYEGAPEELRGKARHLRILNIEPKTYTYWYKRPYISTGPVVSAVQSDGVKRILGTVPIEPDGSVSFRAPAGVALHFQLLDERYRALQTMRSFTGVLPGERRGCVGCHELHATAPGTRHRARALGKPPQAITPPPWGDETVGYARFVQPVLDSYCVPCHRGEGEGKAPAEPNLTYRPGSLVFSEPYLLLTGRPTWGKPYAPPTDPPPGFGIAGTILVEGYSQRDPRGYTTPPPMTRLSYRSRLIEIASSGEHHGVRVDPLGLRRLIAWVDAMAPFRGREEIDALPDPDFQGIDWLAVRPRVRTAPRIVRPGPLD